MRDLVRGARSLLAVLLVGLLFVLVGSPVLRLFVLPGAWLFPGQRFRLVSVYMKMMSRLILALLRLGGARVRRTGVLPTAGPVLVVANHQSLLDILQISLLAEPRVPAFVTRRRYARFVPLVSASVRLLGSPIVDPRRDPAGAIAAVRRGAREAPHGIVIFPEGHRSRDGSIRPFRTGGIEAALTERRMPVHLVVNDGVWRVRRLTDLLFRVHLIDAWSQTLGPFEPPSDPAAIPGFVEALRTRIAARLEQHRREDAAPA
jgi:1-acyl-sn-glycerol-3-phosphate acyltransferase